MNKIVIAVSSIISNKDKITNVIGKGTEYFFLYNNKYKWSIKKENEGDIYLNYYPDDIKLDELVRITTLDGINYVTYRASDLDLKFPYKEKTFEELYLILKEEVFGVDKVLDDIIGDMPY